jgi:hypothetical protein
MAKIILKLSILVVLFIILSILGFTLYYDIFQKTHLASYIDKIKRLESLQYANKAVFIGGSATHFGLQAELFEKETNISSVNMGLHGGGSFKMYMDNVLPYLNDGDMLFLCPEYEYYSRLFDEISGESIDLMYLSSRTIFQNTKIFYKIKTIPETLTIGWRHLGNIIKYHIALLTNNNYMDLFLGDYRRDYSDVYGDYKGIKDIPNRVFGLDHSIIFEDKMFISKLDKYADYLTWKNIEIYLLFPPASHSLFESSNTEIKKIYSRISSLKNIQVLFYPQEVIYKDCDFFNTNYHLNYNAAIKHTKYIISKYKNQKSR